MTSLYIGMSHRVITYHPGMARWEPDAAGRLREAALELYVAQGYEQTAVAEIAARAGVTARTFFRHFADKREVLFAGSEQLQERMVAALEDAPPDAGPLTAVAEAMRAAAEMLGDDHGHSRRRQAVIGANPELLERELIKMARLAQALTGGLIRRGAADAEARLAAEAGIAVFRIGFERWVAGPPARRLEDVLRESMAQLRKLTA
jgi:AcrR family transcriptional regulator